tara:strand:- start:1247 stop:2071 length:825 start_codon:yes stop_codon:yes gene_type:complete
MIPVASVVTQKTISEFNLLKISFEQYHQCHWFLSCDQSAYDTYNNLPNVTCLNIIETDDCDHNINDEAKKDNWMKVMMTKFDACYESLEKYGQVLFLDSDMVFVNPLEDKILELFDNKNIDAAICQHMTNNWQVESKHGLYNGGMFHIKNKDFLDSWYQLSVDYKKYGFYFEQQPLEFVQRNFVSLNLPINYNIGWWRFNNASTAKRLNQLYIKNNQIWFGNRPAINFHVHTSRHLEYQNFGQFLVDKICSLFNTCDNKNYSDLLPLITEKENE